MYGATQTPEMGKEGGMAELQIKPGTKLQVAFDVPMGQKTDFNMMATYKGAVDEAYFLISVPMLAGKPLIFGRKPEVPYAVQRGRKQLHGGRLPRIGGKGRHPHLLEDAPGGRASHLLQAP